MEEFNIQSTPIEKGVFQIQANAGTGKTYTLENLCVRLIKEKSLLPENILMLTFSNQAVAELKKRVTQKFINEWLINNQDNHKLTEYVHLLNFEIYTFHAFFYKIINELDFLTNSPVYETLTTEPFQIYRQLAGKFFRDFMYESAELTDFLMEIRKDFFRSEKNVTALIGKLFGLILYSPEDKPSYDEFTGKVSQWLNDSLETQKIFHDEKTAFIQFLNIPDNINKKSLNKNTLPNFINGLDVLEEKSNGAKIYSLFCEVFKGDWKGTKIKNQDAFSFKFYERLSALKKDHEKLMAHFFRFFSAYINQNMNASAGTNITYDLIQKTALELSFMKPVRKILREKYHAVLADEYQDTDIIQQEFLKNVFFDNDSYTFLVGDSKQSIYQFRGASLYTQHDDTPKIQPKLYSLSVNYRSQRNLIQAVNTLFNSKNNPFIYDSFIVNPPSSTPDIQTGETEGSGTFILNTIKYETVKPSAPVQFDLILRTLAHRIRELLSSEISDSPQTFSEIAILTRKNKKAKEIHRYLTQCHIPSYLFIKDNLLETGQSKHIYGLMHLMLEPATADIYTYLVNNELLGYTLNNINALRDENEMDTIRSYFFEARQIWQNSGIYAAFQFLDECFGMTVRLVHYENGENKYQNHESILRLLRELETEKQLSPLNLTGAFEKLLTTREYQKAKQDNSQDAVKIYTVHASKGLEFPCVLIPLENYNLRTGNFDVFHDPKNQYSPSPVMNQDDKDHFNNEVTAEEIRILYVAVTRAVKHCEIILNESIKCYRSILDSVTEQKADCLKVINTSEADLNKQAENTVALQEEQTYKSRQFKSVDYDFINKKSFSSLINKDYTRYTGKNISDVPTVKNSGLYGINFGLLIHELIEKIEFQATQNIHDDPKLQKILKTYRIEETDTAYIWGVLDTLFKKTLNDQVNGQSFKLSQISQKCLIKELMFTLRLRRCDLKQVVTTDNEFSKEVKAGFDRITGNHIIDFLDGFIDAVAEFNGKLYILDWKTNFLGDHAENYDRNEMATEMKTHNYHIQMLFYTLALKQYVFSRFGKIPFEDIFGGVFYLFIRGIEQKENDHGVFFVDKEQILPVIDCFAPYLEEQMPE